MFSDTRRRQTVRSSCSGYTLIEVLIATVIFTAMVMLAVAALDQGMKRYKVVLNEGVSFWKHARGLWLSRSLAATVGYYVDEDNVLFPYFRCMNDGISYVSATAMASDPPVVVWLIKERSKTSGRYDLRYYELPAYTRNHSEISAEHSSGNYKKGMGFTVYEAVESVDTQCYIMDPLTKLWNWENNYDAKDGKYIPARIKVIVKQDGKKYETFFTIHTNRSVKPDPYVI